MGLARSGSRVREAVIATARNLVVENGADRLRMTAVLRNTGIARGTLYNTVRNKDELLVALVIDATEELVDAAVAAGNGDLFDSLIAIGELLASDGLVASLRESAAKDARNVGWCADESIAQVGRAGVSRVMAAAGCLPDGSQDPRVELIFRWAATQAASPQTGEPLRSCVTLLSKVCQ